MSEFRRRAQQIRTSAASLSFTVLVWGPGEPSEGAGSEARAGFEKREQIKQSINEAFPNSEVKFSEELMDIEAGVESALMNEALQARVADVVIALDIGRGVGLEIDHFVPDYPWIRDKIFILTQEEHLDSGGLVREVHDYLRPFQIIGYTESEFEECLVASELAVKVAHGAAMKIALEGSSFP